MLQILRSRAIGAPSITFACNHNTSLNLLQVNRNTSTNVTNGCPVDHEKKKDNSKESSIKNVKDFKDIPGPKAYPIIGNTWRFLPIIGEYQGIVNRIMEFFDSLERDYGKIVKIESVLGQPDAVYLLNPDDIEKVYKVEGVVPERAIFPSMTYFRNHMRQDIFKEAKGLVTSDGEQWYSFRNKVNSIMMQPKTVKQYVNPVDKISRELVKKIKKIRGEDNKISIDFLKEINKWSLESIAYIALNTKLNCLSDNLSDDSLPSRLIRITEDVFTVGAKLDFEPSLWRYFSTPAFKRGMKTYEEQVIICQELIEKAIVEINKNKELGLDGNLDSEPSVLEKILKIDKNVATVMALDMLIAGVDTTSMTLINTLYYLATNLAKQEILRGEIISLLTQKTSKLTTEHLNSMPYLRACIKEAMRLYPVTPGTMRILTKDIVLSGYNVPKGTEVLFLHMHLSMREDQFVRPDEFIPERWLRSQVDTEISYKNAHPFSSLPFGFGARSCIGRRFSELELEIAIINFIRNFNLSWDGPPPKRTTTSINYLKGPYHFVFKNNDIILHGDMACINNQSI